MARGALAALLLPRGAWAFAAQVAVSATGLAVGVGMLVAGKEPAVYLPMVASIVGYWLPAPRVPTASEWTPQAADRCQSSEGSVCGGQADAVEKNDE